ncbi:hypothetical protein [Wansuia hejianensis]|uniref:Uncharacterized protein n=1 Tax=Wansuia hejianensis TaxID=2763667 RepID=A0A7G9G8R7_9FIRM|nr:hypothetical protein [Wansuia hejianensis]QNM07199.1 hypothetical protein H9Q79_09515 [Wansuia hejianensis]RHV91234.1 hypothetical protein DXA96_03450 [Lachnospiraceae bacterium OF09-33XD]
MFETRGKLYKAIGGAIIIIAIIATICYCRSERIISSEYLENSIKYPHSYALEDAEAEDYTYPVAKGFVIVAFASALGILICGIGDIVDRLDTKNEPSENKEI